MDQDGERLLGDVRMAQEELGSGSVDEALVLVDPLLVSTLAAIGSSSFLARTAKDKHAVMEAFCFARVTAILALETVGARQAVPRIRQLAAEARDVAGSGTDGWRIQSAAAEMLSRCGDGPGAVDALAAAVRVAPAGEPYVEQLRASLRTMFPDIVH